jgi:hypothetical protein
VVAPPVVMPPDEPEPMEPFDIEPLDMDPLDIDPLDIEPLLIEPLFEECFLCDFFIGLELIEEVDIELSEPMVFWAKAGAVNSRAAALATPITFNMRFALSSAMCGLGKHAGREQSSRQASSGLISDAPAPGGLCARWRRPPSPPPRAPRSWRSCSGQDR